jgi:hypothetical protein
MSQVIPEANQLNNATTAVVLYDADAQQTVYLEVTRDGRVYDVFHTIRPCTDEQYVEYGKALKPKLRVHPDKSVERLTDVQGASEFLYGDLLDEVRGWGDPKGANVDAKQKRLVIAGGLLLCVTDRDDEAVLKGNADEDRPWEKPERSAIPVRCRFNGEELVTNHFPTGTPSRQQRERYEGLQNRKKFKAGARMSQTDIALLPPEKALGTLYKELFDESRAEGYKPGTRVPLWHKCEAVSALFEEDEERVGES